MRTIQLADFKSFSRLARRSRGLQAAAALVALAAAIAAYGLAPRSTAPSDPLVAKGATTIVVVDLSASISWDTFARIATTLDRLRTSKTHVGLILFSDTAYQALPPGTPSSELASFERFFVVKQPSQPGFAPEPPSSPWTTAFSAGTRISTGLSLALEQIRSHALHKPQVLLISDLNDDTSDIESLTSVALAYRHLGVPITVAALNPSPEDANTMERLLPHGGSLVDVPLSLQAHTAAHNRVPRSLVVCAVLLALALAAGIVLTHRLQWAAP
jgi:hypothetical protein